MVNLGTDTPPLGSPAALAVSYEVYCFELMAALTVVPPRFGFRALAWLTFTKLPCPPQLSGLHFFEKIGARKKLNLSLAWSRKTVCSSS